MNRRLSRPVRYIDGHDGARIAVSRLGAGMVSIVFVPGAITQLEVAWEEPLYARFLSKVATFAEVVVFDRRGTGLSDAPTGTATLNDLVLDIGSVVDSCAGSIVVLFGFSMGALAAIRFAAAHADRLAGLVIVAGMERWRSGTDQDFGLSRSAFAMMIDNIEDGWGTGASLPASAPSMLNDSRFLQWGAKMERHTCPPGRIRSVFQLAADSDVRVDVATVITPALVMHRSGDMVVDVDHGRALADRLPDCRYVELSGTDHLYFVGDQNAILRELADFTSFVTPVEVSKGAVAGSTGGADPSASTALTGDEHDVADLVGFGLTNQEIARRLVVSRHTVDSRLRRIYRKLGINTRAELAAVAWSLNR